MREEIVSGPVSLFASSPGLEPDRFDVVVTMPTFRRPEHAALTLRSLSLQKTARRFALIVMENDAEGLEGARAAESFFSSGALAGFVLLVHERGNCRAYNAGWEMALARFPAFQYLLVIDDDEVASPDWIENLCATADRFDADVVGGPQLPVFESKNPPAAAAHPVFRPHWSRTGPVQALYSSGNLLLRRGVLEAFGPPHLDLRFNFLGGGDSDFLSRAQRRGFRLAWCAEAPVHETVPARRLEADWIRARSLRNGVISTLVEKRRRSGERLSGLRVLAKSVALVAASPFRAVLKAVQSGSVSEGTYHIYVAAGRLLAEFGYAREQYREPEKN